MTSTGRAQVRTGRISHTIQPNAVGSLQPGVDGFAFERERAEGSLVDAGTGLAKFRKFSTMTQLM